MSSFRNKGANLSDLIVVCQDKTFRVHRTFLTSRSAVFAAMLAHDTKEANEGKIEIPDADPDTVELFLR